jgi:hypothetical protein
MKVNDLNIIKYGFIAAIINIMLISNVFGTVFARKGERVLIEGMIVAQNIDSSEFSFIVIDSGKSYTGNITGFNRLAFKQNVKAIHKLPIFYIVRHVDYNLTKEIINEFEGYVKLYAIAIDSVSDDSPYPPSLPIEITDHADGEFSYGGGYSDADKAIYNYLLKYYDNYLMWQEKTDKGLRRYFGYWQINYIFSSWDDDYFKNKLVKKRIKDEAKALATQEGLKEHEEPRYQITQKNNCIDRENNNIDQPKAQLPPPSYNRTPNHQLIENNDNTILMVLIGILALIGLAIYSISTSNLRNEKPNETILIKPSNQDLINCFEKDISFEDKMFYLIDEFIQANNISSTDFVGGKTCRNL